MNADVKNAAINKEKFEHAIRSIDGLLAITRSNKLDVSHVFEGIIPKSRRIEDHIAFFKSLNCDAVRTRANNKDFIYFSFPYSRLQKYATSHFVAGDVLVIRYLTSDLSDEADVLSINATIVNGSI